MPSRFRSTLFSLLLVCSAVVYGSDIAEIEARFELPAGSVDGAVSWSAIPLDEHMAPEAWAPIDPSLVGAGYFEQGRWQVSAYSDDGTEFAALVDIRAGQQNVFTLQRMDRIAQIAGEWTLWAIPPADTSVEAVNLIDFIFAHDPDGSVNAQWRLLAERNGSELGGRIGAVDETRISDERLLLSTQIAELGPHRLVIELVPRGSGYVGTMTVAPEVVSVALWQHGQSLPKLESLRSEPAEQASGASAAHVPELVFQCPDESCTMTGPRGLSLRVPRGWGFTEPLFVSATVGAHASENPRMEFHGPDGEELLLNPHQWLNSNGPCLETSVGPLCHFSDASIVTRTTADSIADGLRFE